VKKVSATKSSGKKTVKKRKKRAPID
jgi:hypothetical protein